MPRDLPQTLLDAGFAGTTRLGSSSGNLTACNIQFFVFTIGISCMFAYNAMLCVYYACAIAFRMTEKTTVKYVEPVLHVVSLIVAPLSSILPFILRKSDLNISDADADVDQTSLSLESIANSCLMARGFSGTKVHLLIIFVVLLIIILISLVSIIVVVKRTESSLYNAGILRHSRLLTDNRLERAKESHENTKVILIQALAYILSFTLTLFVFPMIRNIDDNAKWATNVATVWTPIQGFFNFVIFVSHKVYNYRRGSNNANDSIIHTIGLLFKGHASETVLVSRLHIIQYNESDELFPLEMIDGDDEVDDSGQTPSTNLLFIEANLSFNDADDDYQADSNDDDCHADSNDDDRQDLSGFSISKDEEMSQQNSKINSKDSI
jgi:hypothetical protein